MSSPATCLPKVTCLNVIQVSSISLATRILLPNHLILTLCDVNEEEKYEIRKKMVKNQKQDLRWLINWPFTWNEKQSKFYKNEMWGFITVLANI